MAVIILKEIILKYSAKKIMAKSPLAYSTLNPETSSDSPSAKSNGARFVSATQVIIQIVNANNDNKIIGKIDWNSKNLVRLYDFKNTVIEMIIRNRETS